MRRKRWSVGAVACWLLLGFTGPLLGETPDALIAQVRQENIEAHIRHLVNNPVGGKPTRSRSAYRRPLMEAAAAYIAQQLRTSPNLEVRYDDFSGMRNVIATLPGTAPDPKVYVVGAHYDSKASRDVDWNPLFSPTPGADDNASGVAAMLELARVLSTRRYRHTIEFVAFDAEEIGLYGSRHYVASALQEDRPIAGMFNVDMIGFNWWYDRVEVVSNRPSAWLANYLWLAADWYGLALEVVCNIDPTLGESDHRPFWDAGYRAVMLSESGTPWMDVAHYVANPFYHTVLDTMDKVNLVLVAKVARLLVGVLADLADREEPLRPPQVRLLPPEQNRENPVILRGEFESDLPLRIVLEPGDVIAQLDRRTGTFQAALRLKGGKNAIRATAINPAGVRTASLTVTFLPEFRFLEAWVFPNPGRELVQFRCLGDRPIDRMTLHIFAPSGTLIRSIEGVPEKGDPRLWRTWWNLKVQGVPVANGVYPCLFEVKVGEAVHRKQILLAVEQ